jgi:hypothetical protein
MRPMLVTFVFLMSVCNVQAQAQYDRYVTIGLQNIPFESKVYVPQTGFYIQGGIIKNFYFEFSGRMDVPRKYNWPNAGQINMLNSRFNLLVGTHILLDSDYKHWNLDLVMMAGFSFLSSRRFFTPKNMRGVIEPWTYKKITLGGFLGVEWNCKLSNHSGLQLSAGAGSYFLKLGYIYYLKPKS